MSRFKYRRPAAALPLKWALAAAVLMIVLLYVPAPYLVAQPGPAQEAAPLVHVGEEAGERDGGFLVMTVYMAGRSNYWMVLQSLWRKDLEAYPRNEILQGGTMDDYAQRMHVLMDHSQSSAVEAAYRQAGISYAIGTKAIVITDPGDGTGFAPGDRITEVDGTALTDAGQLLELLKDKAGEDGQQPWRIAVERGGVSARVEVPKGGSAQGNSLDEQDLPRLLGVDELTVVKAIVPEDPAHQVEIKAGEVAGPSAGLAFALEIYDRLTGGELAEGRKIAATGTISPDGSVGAIGGAALKVIAAQRAGAQMFLVPKGNYKEAARQAEATGTSMVIIPVATLAEALEGLKGNGF
ncbi:YlbL family protein [Paenibacillus sambharensis]|uniref:YlbL family protein n=1 Tax=Paenibacillus sambharensis TaxID=1803190 RepID=UPI0015E8E12C|nr:S16 family serine protease [Paenibacillus sambharensis]